MVPWLDCGQEKVVVAESTASEDGHFAAAWTIQPKGDKPAVDWSAYERENPLALVDRYGVNSNPTAGPGDENDPGKSGYLLLNGVVDLAAKRFMPLTTDDPWFPYKTRAALRAVWSTDRHGVRYAAIGNTVGSKYTEGNVDLWLVELNAQGMNVVDLKPGADEAVQGFLHRHDPKDADQYQWSFSFDDKDEKTKGLHTGFKQDVLALHFIATVPDKTNAPRRGLRAISTAERRGGGKRSRTWQGGGSFFLEQSRRRTCTEPTGQSAPLGRACVSG